MSNLKALKKDINKILYLKKKIFFFNKLSKLYLIGSYFNSKNIILKNNLEYLQKKIDNLYFNKPQRNSENLTFHIKLPPTVPSPKKKNLTLNLENILNYDQIKITTPTSTISNNSNSSSFTNISISSEEIILDNKLIDDKNYTSFINPLYNKTIVNNYVLNNS